MKNLLCEGNYFSVYDSDSNEYLYISLSFERKEIK